ncbi:Na(+)-translocating NADH-quinone reductase subunit C [Bowmanella sp. JS7-9]|uniref:Na(+)-translocating NADH-quinone reductase subunit C n=1 Tax=Pseudobowmanella zhangzhouensis TaxID=1537679 RepID=A0ABW1XLV7_9ALTE|nr:Na(+)-translocating NADH-quinone reductase subunit C [Bowmanella sp. JS7-9]TBX22025.1 Na(+)-translocating NADH-quinone reductase subunit C [Bowmanella sp. JS7-9]
MSAKKETFAKTLGVVLGVCLVCSVVVAGSAVGLRSVQEKNAQLDKQTNILEAAGLLAQAKGDIAATYNKYVEEKFVDLETGEYVDAPYPDYDMFGPKARKQENSIKPLPDTAGINRRPNVASVYLVKSDQGELQRIVLPVYGSGLWDLMYAFLSLDADAQTIRELVYYQQKETPGLGGEVLNPSWKAKWDGKQIFNGDEVAITVKKNAGENNPYAVDGLSGATLTSNGVDNQLQYWLGENGFGPYLKKMKRG